MAQAFILQIAQIFGRRETIGYAMAPIAVIVGGAGYYLEKVLRSDERVEKDNAKPLPLAEARLQAELKQLEDEMAKKKADSSATGGS
eukprot:m.91917 g.91917  ORF g.91917 m.91917 type:complete len:87 (+) comp13321_c0_seq1:288-548(+)